MSLKIRQGIVLMATGVFFCVAIAAQLQGAAGPDVYMKAGAACLILVAGGLILVRIVDDAWVKSQGTARAGREPGAAPGVAHDSATTGGA
ncbi:MAG: hypothetical protein ACRDIE_25785 [Chloroflexota bacterium]